MAHPLLGRLLAWFSAPASPRPLGVFRIALAAFCLVRFVPLRHEVLSLCGQYGLVQWAISRTHLSPVLPHLGDLALLLQPLGVTADQTVWLVVALFVAALVGLLLGWHTRRDGRRRLRPRLPPPFGRGGLLYGMDVFTHIGLLYVAVMPAGDAYSLDVRAGRRQDVPSEAAGVTRRMLQVHLALVYFSSGLEKAAGPGWWNGDVIWRAVSLPVFRQVDPAPLASVPFLAAAAGWLVLFLELGYGFFVFRASTRRFALLGALVLHVSIGAFLGMWLFAAIMVILNLCAFGPEALEDLRLRRPSPAPATAGAPAGPA